MPLGRELSLDHLPVDDGADDAELLTRIRAGDRKLFAVLMRRYNQRLYRAVRAILRQDDEAEDVVQFAYLAAYQNLDQFRGEASFITWLTRIAVHQALARARDRTRRADLAVLSSQLDVAPATPEDDASSRELGRILERQIDALPDLYRSVFVLRDVEELTTAETAAALAITEEAVRVRLHRARHLLQNALVEGIGPASAHVFRFDGERCDRIVLGVLSHLIDLP
jgi:RNA polymerase sigma-70 factor (ECF subfamily)